MEKELIHKN